jgi:hypothetical protein
VEIKEIRTYVIWIVGGLLVWALASERCYERNAPAGQQKTLNEGQDLDVAITLVSTDFHALACSSGEEVTGRHCEFSNKNEKWNKPSTSGRSLIVDTLAPYKTTDDILLLVPALFSEPALVERLAIDPPTQNQEHIRFVANCKMHVVGRMKDVDVRWQQNGQWFGNRDVPIGTVTGCWISDG